MQKSRASSASPASNFTPCQRTLLAHNRVFCLRREDFLRDQIGDPGRYHVLARFTKLILKRDAARDYELLPLHVDEAHLCLSVFNDVRELLPSPRNAMMNWPAAIDWLSNLSIDEARISVLVANCFS